jgi:MFS family permease
MPRYIAKDRQFADLSTVNLIFGGIVVVSGLGATFLGGITGDKLRDRFPGSYFLVSGAAMLLGFPLVLLVLVTPFPWAFIFVFLACFCLFFNTGPTNTVLANVTHPAIRASGFALNIFVIHALGDAISPWVIGAISDHTRATPGPFGLAGLNAGFAVVSVLILVGGLLWLWGARYLERDTARAPLSLGANAAAPPE